MFWNFHSSLLEEPNIDEKEQAMGLHTNIIVVSSVLEGVRMHILRQVMDLNCLTWIFDLCLVEQTCFAHFSPPNPSHVSIVAPNLGHVCWCKGGGGGGGGGITFVVMGFFYRPRKRYGCWERIL
jgi:hypothetical protein